MKPPSAVCVTSIGSRCSPGLPRFLPSTSTSLGALSGLETMKRTRLGSTFAPRIASQSAKNRGAGKTAHSRPPFCSTRAQAAIQSATAGSP